MPATAGPLSIPSPVGCLRSFVFADYDAGQLTDLPLWCPHAEMIDDCHVVLHNHRDRKTGPCHPLAVVRCLQHDVSFTVYPTGFTPYSRRPLTTSIDATDPSLVDVCSSAEEGPWPRGGGEPPGVWSTQVRLIERAAAINGMTGDVAVRDAWAAATGVPLTWLFQGQHARGYRRRGAAVLRVAAGRTLEELLLGGYLAGCWGLPWMWERSPQRLRCVVLPPLWRIGSTTLGPRAPPDGG